LSDLDIIFKDLGLKIPVNKIESVKLHIDPDNTGVFSYTQLIAWLESDDNKGYFSMIRTVQNIYTYLMTSKDKKFKTNAKELISLAAQKRTKTLLQSYTNIGISDKPSPVSLTPLNPTLLTPLTKSKPKSKPKPNFNPNPQPKLNPHSSAKSNLNPHSSAKSNPHFNPDPTQNPVKPYETSTQNIDIQLLEMDILETIGELKLVRKVNKEVNANLRNKWFYLRLVLVYLFFMYIYICMYEYIYISCMYVGTYVCIYKN
jgi:hypothetical protein